MGIADLFRPKYRHSDVRVRTEAVRALTRDDADLLTQIARTDREPSVRRLAIEKIDAAEVLATIAREDAERALRDLAGDRASEIWTHAASGTGPSAAAALDGLIALGEQRAIAEVAARAQQPEIRKRALVELRDAKALAELARIAPQSETRLEALGRIADKDVLRGLALDSNHKEVGIAAVDRIDDEATLDFISHKAKAKQVKQRARKKLTELEDSARARRPAVNDDVKRRRAEHAQLLRELEGLGETFDFERSTPIVERIQAAWAALGTADEPHVEERFQKAAQRYQQRRDVHLHAHDDQKAAHDAEVRARREAAAAEKAAAERAAVDAAEAAAAAAAPDPEREARMQEAAARRAEREAKRAEDEAKKAADAAARAERQKEEAERGKQIAVSLGALIDELEQVGATGDGRAIDRVLAQAQKAFEQLPKVPPAEREPLGKRYGDVRAKLVIQVKELRDAEDWQRWANVPRLEALIKEAEALLELDDVSGPDLGLLLKDLQSRWKTIGPAPQKRSKELWDQFKATCDKVYEKVKVGRDAEKEKWAQSAAAKEQLIASAEALAASTDWDGTAQELKALQAKWKDSGPLPRKQGDELWKRFRTACDRFFEARKPVLDARRDELVKNLETKQAMCARAEAVVAAAPGERGWGPAINEIKALQQQWRDVGFVPRRDADAVYARFRAACDALFVKRDEARDAEANARRAEAEGLRTEIEAITSGAAGDDAVARALAVSGQLRELAERDTTPSAELSGLVDRMLRAVVSAAPDQVKGTELDPEAMRVRREKIVQRAEALMPRSGPSLSGGESPAELAAKLKSAMASNALGHLRMDRDPVEVVDELRAEWRAIGPVLDDASEALSRRFDEVAAAVLKAHGAEDRPRPAREARGDDGDGGEDRGKRRRDRRDRRRDRGPDEAGLGAEAPVAAAAVLEAAREPAAVVPLTTPVSTGDDVVTTSEQIVEPSHIVTTRDVVSEPSVTVSDDPEAEPPVISEVGPGEVASAASDSPVVIQVAPAPAPRRRSITDPPPPDVIDDAWGIDEHVPAPREAAPEASQPAAAEMAGDGAVEGEGLDTGWD
jgi:hypothetical protein